MRDTNEPNRDLFAELMEGMEALKAMRLKAEAEVPPACPSEPRREG